MNEAKFIIIIYFNKIVILKTIVFDDVLNLIQV